MKKTPLIFTFHNPNYADITANHVLSALIKANMAKIESQILHTINAEKQKNHIHSSLERTSISYIL